jgi:hypothetical protein
MTLVALASIFPCSLMSASPALATPLPPSLSPLPGSPFQGGDGNQDNAPPRIDWQALQAAGRVHHSPDSNDQDTAFVGGSKENLPLNPAGTLWDFTTEAGGVDPPKSNILDAWSTFDPQGPNAFLYLAFTRQGVMGTTFATFELNHDSRLWNNGRADIPCRRTGDVLVSYEAQGNDVDVIVQRWVTLTTHAATGCATAGRLDDFTNFEPNVYAQGGINEAAIVSYLPGSYQGMVEPRHFGEAALNIGRLLGEGFDDPCVSFGSFWMHSRSSTARFRREDSSNLQDYVAPQSLPVRACAASGTKFHDLNTNGRLDPGEPGLPRFVIWADYDDDGVRDIAEPFGITDSEGQYVINDIRPPDGTYTLRETLLTQRARRRAAAGNVTCSYPNESTPGGIGSAPGGMFPCGWPINIANTTYARNRDFGNYQAVGPPPPPPPLPPPPPPPAPPPPSPIIPPGPKPPDANDPGHAGIRLPQAFRGCIGPRVPRVNLQGTRVARIQVFVNGRLRRRITMGALQRRVTPRVKLAPGRYRLRVRVTFQLGSGSPPEDLKRVIRVCAPRVSRPRFTG